MLHVRYLPDCRTPWRGVAPWKRAPTLSKLAAEIEAARGAYRSIPLDGRPHLPQHIRQYLGDARGHWEDNTLVVDTTNFTHQTNYEGSRENLHLVERFTRVAPDLITYRATIDDPTVFTRPWTLEIPLTKQDDKANQIYESACQEGNYALTSILAGARLQEKEATTSEGSS